MFGRKSKGRCEEDSITVRVLQNGDIIAPSCVRIVRDLPPCPINNGDVVNYKGKRWTAISSASIGDKCCFSRKAPCCGHYIFETFLVVGKGKIIKIDDNGEKETEKKP